MADKLVSVNDDYDFPAPVAARQAEKVAVQVAGQVEDAVTPITGILDGAFRGLPLITYGHSFLAEQGLSDPSQYYARRLAAQYGLIYPTLNTTHDLKRAVGGSLAVDAAQRVIGDAPFVPGTKAVVLVQALINSARLHGAQPIDLTTARNSLRSMVAAFNAASRVENTSTAFTYSGTDWTQSPTTAGYSAGTIHYTHSNANNGQYVEFTVPANGAYLVLTGKNASTGPTVQVTDVTAGGAILDNFTLANQCVSTSSFVPYAYRTPDSARGHVVRLTKTGGTTSLSVDVLLPQSTTPPPVILMKEPYLADYSKSTMFPNGSDAVLDSFNALIDEMAAEFPNVIVANPNNGDHWSEDDGLQGDGVHPNAKGNAALKDAAIDAVRTQTFKKLVRGAYGLN